jgi:hypothetical protein
MRMRILPNFALFGVLGLRIAAIMAKVAPIVSMDIHPSFGFASGVAVDS